MPHNFSLFGQHVGESVACRCPLAQWFLFQSTIKHNQEQYNGCIYPQMLDQHFWHESFLLPHNVFGFIIVQKWPLRKPSELKGALHYFCLPEGAGWELKFSSWMMGLLGTSCSPTEVAIAVTCVWAQELESYSVNCDIICSMAARVAALT